MGIDQARHDNTAAGIYGSVCCAFDSSCLTDFDDVVIFDVHTTVSDKAVGFIECHQMSIGDQQ